MNDLKDLLNRIYNITERDERIKQERKFRGEYFNIFDVLGLSTEEVRLHSAFLAELLDITGNHGLKDAFLKEFITHTIHDEKFDFDTSNSKIDVEFNIGNATETAGGRIDILISSKDKIVVIENKIYAGDQENQLLRYHNYCEKQKCDFKILYLTLDGKNASEKSLGNKNSIVYEVISYRKHILQWLDKCAKIAVQHPLIRETINQYIVLIKKLTNQNMEDASKKEIMDVISSNPKYVKAALNIGNYISEIQESIVTNFATEISQRFKEEITTERSYDKGFYFRYKNDYFFDFSLYQEKLICSIKNEASLNGESGKYDRANIFKGNSDSYTPYGYDYVGAYYWNADLYEKMAERNEELIADICEWIKKMKEYIDATSCKSTQNN